MFALTPRRKQDIQTQLDSLFDTFWNDFFSGLEPSYFTNENKSGYPRLDIQELDDKFLIDATVPGMAKEDVKVTILDEQGQKYLSIRSDKKEQKEIRRENFLRKEIHRSSFCRNLTLPENVEESNIGATVKDGILTIEIPKKNAVKQVPKIHAVEIK